MIRRAICALSAAAVLSAPAAGKPPRTVFDEARARDKGWIVLLYGEDWSPAGTEIAAMLKSPAFAAATRGRYLCAFRDDRENPPPGGKARADWEKRNAYAAVPGLDSHKLPALFAGDGRGGLFLVKENLSAGLSPEELAADLEEAAARKKALEKKYLVPAFKKLRAESAELCGEFLAAMEEQAGGIAVLRGEAACKRVWDRMAEQDPHDSTGWRRRFTAGDGIGTVAKATRFREDGDIEGGRKFLEAEKSKSPAHLSTEQKQALLMAEFALHRDDPYREAENIKLLSGIAEMDYSTLWGAAAVGWMKRLGDPPPAVRIGWSAKHMSAPEFKVTVHYGVKEAFRDAGVYDISFRRDGTGGEFSIDRIVLRERGRVLAEAVKPQVSADGLETVFSLRFNPEFADMVTHVDVFGRADAEGAGCAVSFNVHRRVLRPRGRAARGTVAPPAGKGTGK